MGDRRVSCELGGLSLRIAAITIAIIAVIGAGCVS